MATKEKNKHGEEDEDDLPDSLLEEEPGSDIPIHERLTRQKKRKWLR